MLEDNGNSKVIKVALQDISIIKGEGNVPLESKADLDNNGLNDLEVMRNKTYEVVSEML